MSTRQRLRLRRACGEMEHDVVFRQATLLLWLDPRGLHSDLHDDVDNDADNDVDKNIDSDVDRDVDHDKNIDRDVEYDVENIVDDVNKDNDSYHDRDVDKGKDVDQYTYHRQHPHRDRTIDNLEQSCNDHDRQTDDHDRKQAEGSSGFKGGGCSKHLQQAPGEHDAVRL
mmetsp:Transcript_121881/g.389796  ORF Transcript_121881/g.389796 Transcript_121881/m.389796 type:complete len:169 (-) Transcript_121881:499-1005(-)